MEWILGATKDIVVSEEQLEARREYIKSVTGFDVSRWTCLQLEGKTYKEFFRCKSDDGLNGVYITAHIGAVRALCMTNEISEKDFVVANTCKWERFSEKDILIEMMKRNKEAELWFSKQALSLEAGCILRQSNTIQDIGNFGFHTSVSERQLFVNRRKGFREAIRLSFEKVSPIILPADFGGLV